jgi:putative transposase
VIYQFVYNHDEYPVAKWAKFYQVSRSGYYTYIKRRERREQEQAVKQQEVRAIFEESGGTYGPDRICGVLRKRGCKASYKSISTMMREMKLESIHNRHKTRSLTDSRKARGDSYINLVKGQSFDKLRQVVSSDITYLKSGEGWLYLCVVKDIVSGEIVGEATGQNIKKDLVIRAFLNAQARHGLAEGTIFHSDRGSQYTSHEFMETLKVYGVRQSFSRVGMPGDNAWAESFFATLKKECIHFKHFTTRDQLAQSIFAWIEGFYNTRRVQARLGYLSPRLYASLLLAGSQAA